jgi:hypothetical protein
MRSVGRTLLAIVAGMVLAFALVVAVEFFSSIVHPFPPGFDPSAPGSIPAHVQRYPGWVLAVAGLMWGATAAAATWVASRIAGRPAGIIVALLLASALAFNLSMLPYVMWFKIAMPGAFCVACLLGIKYGRRAPSPVGAGNTAPGPGR